MTKRPSTPLLDTVNVPADMKRLSHGDLRQLADELRTEMIDAVSTTGGHLGAGLGVIELTVALHYVFNTPDDRLIWDVGHQAYPHKILTGRRDRIRTLRQGGGLSGFTKRSESEYDPFGAAHSSTSISAAIGFAVANKLKGQPGKAIAVIGDGSMSAGMAYEAMNNASQAGNRLVVILNDNDMSIAPPVGALSAYLSRLFSSRQFLELREAVKQISRKVLPPPLKKAAAQADEYARGLMQGGGTLFEELGFYYVGPIDGHNLDHLLPVLENVRDAAEGPILIHVVTQKGKGYAPAEAAADKYHGVVKFDVVSGAQHKATPSAPAYQNVFGDALIAEARRDPSIVAITAAMPSGTGVDRFNKAFPDRTFDVGIAEQHAVTAAAGMAMGGMRPVVALYSTFLNRAWDQVVYDVAMHRLPVIFCLDRAGITGDDGPSHHGVYDMALLSKVPGMRVLAPSSTQDLQQMLSDAIALADTGPVAIRYPKGLARNVDENDIGSGLQARKLVDGPTKRVCILAIGKLVAAALEAAETLKTNNVDVTVWDVRSCAPLDPAMIADAMQHDVVITAEDGIRDGGIGMTIENTINDLCQAETGHKCPVVQVLGVPTTFVPTAKPNVILHQMGLDAQGIVATVLNMLGMK